MRRLLILASVVIGLCALPAQAAPPASPVFNWSGFYIGANAGGAWNDARATDAGGANGCWGTCDTQWSAHTSGWTGGVQAAWLQQYNWFVAGVVGDIGYLGLRERSTVHPTACCPPDDPTLLQTRGGWFGTARGLFGVPVMPAVLLFGTVGVIDAELRTTVFRPSDLRTGNFNGLGWTGGGGVMVAIDGRWFWTFEYLFYDLGSERRASNQNCCDFTVDQRGQILRVGLNLKFGG